MKTLGWPYPSVVAGSFRTAIVKATPGRDFSGKVPEKLLEISVAGVFPIAHDELFLPAPADCVWESTVKKNMVHWTSPDSLKAGEGADFPLGELRPVMLTVDQAPKDFKPKPPPGWWPLRSLIDWLLEKDVTFDKTFLLAALSERRDHVQLDFDSGVAAESRLFATAGLTLTHLRKFGIPDEAPFLHRYEPITLAARVETPDEWSVGSLDHLHPLGGERRLVHWKASGDPKLWECPETVRTALGSTFKVRMILATPAIFEHGWRPGWLDETLTGYPPAGGPKLTLVGVSIQRWKAVSGWSLAKQSETGKPGPKAIRRLVPAGGVYFFETKDNAGTLANQWLKSVSDKPQDQRDGFGLAVWGTWGRTNGGNG
jgi:CRISPR-associated protein Cmr3